MSRPLSLPSASPVRRTLTLGLLVASMAACTPFQTPGDSGLGYLVKRGQADWGTIRQLPGVSRLVEAGDWALVETREPQRLQAHVALIEPNQPASLPLVKSGGFQTALQANDPFFRLPSPVVRQQAQWGLTAIQAPSAWDLSQGDGVVVAVVDTGIDTAHPDLAPNLAQAGVNLLDPGGAVSDDFGHGTHVSGIIAAVTNNGVGMAGTAGRARLLPIRVADGAGGHVFNIARGIRQAVDMGAKVINVSVGNRKPSRFLKEVVDEALARGVVIVAAAGNGALEGNAMQYPAAYPGVIAVGAVGLDQTALVGGRIQYVRPDFSSFNSEVTVSAPGVDILSTVPMRYGEYAYASGTSMAAPFVSGTVAMMLGRNPALTPQQVLDKLQITAVDLGAPGLDTFYGAGLINAAAAVQ